MSNTEYRLGRSYRSLVEAFPTHSDHKIYKRLKPVSYKRKVEFGPYKCLTIALLIATVILEVIHK
jgi:hypothetical protein